MVFPVQSAFAAGLLLTVAFSLGDPTTAPVQPPSGDAGLQLACDQADSAAVPGSDIDLASASACNRSAQR